MANDLTTTTDLPHSVVAISRLASRPRAWTKTEALSLAGEDPIAALTAARAHVAASFAPVPTGEARRQWEAAIAERLDPIAAKIAPTMSVAQGTAWRAAMINALSNLPAMIVLTAAKRALHRPTQFISEVDGVVRECATEIIAERQDAIRRIEYLITSLEMASRPALPEPETSPPPPREEIEAEIARVTNPELKRVLHETAVQAGWIEPRDDSQCSEYVPVESEAA